MAEDIKLKDLYDEEQTYSEIGTIAVPKEDGSGDTYYVQRPLITYTLQDPPTHELTDADAGMFTWNAGDGTLIAPSGVADDGNVVGMVYAAKEGKTTKPIVRLEVSKNLTGIETGGNSVTLLYCWEEVTSANLKEIFYGANGSDLPEFTTQIGWGYLTQDYTKIADTSAVTIGIQQPNTIKEGPFYALLAEESLEEKAVTITEKGAQTVVPTVGKSGMSKVNLQVDVAGGNLQEKAVTVTADGIASNGMLWFSDGSGYIDVRPDAGYDGVSYAQVVVKAKMLGEDDISVTDLACNIATIELNAKDGYIGYAPGIIFNAACTFQYLKFRETGERVPSADGITKNGVYDIMTDMSAKGVYGSTGVLGSFGVNVETPPAPTLGVFQILEEVDSSSRREILLENCTFAPTEWLNLELWEDETVGHRLVKNNCQWNPTGVVNEDGTITVDVGNWPVRRGLETVTGMVNEDGSVTLDLGELYPKPSVAWSGYPGRLNGWVNEDGTVIFPWIYYKTGTAQMFPIESTT